MQQIISLQIVREDRTPVNEYDWKKILGLKENESVEILDFWIIRGTKMPDKDDIENQ